MQRASLKHSWIGCGPDCAKRSTKHHRHNWRWQHHHQNSRQRNLVRFAREGLARLGSSSDEFHHIHFLSSNSRAAHHPGNRAHANDARACLTRWARWFRRTPRSTTLFRAANDQWHRHVAAPLESSASIAPPSKIRDCHWCRRGSWLRADFGLVSFDVSSSGLLVGSSASPCRRWQENRTKTKSRHPRLAGVGCCQLVSLRSAGVRHLSEVWIIMGLIIGRNVL